MTSSTQGDISESHEILKVDSQGRVQVPKKRREALLEEFDRSGMTGAAFARHYGIRYTTFAYWLRARRIKQQQPRRKAGEKFLLIEAKPEESSSGQESLDVELPNGCKVSVHSRNEAELAAVLINSLRTEK